MGINYLDLFSGIGGFHLGMLMAGVKIGWCGYSEIDKYAQKIYAHHFPESEYLGDVKKIEAYYRTQLTAEGSESPERQGEERRGERSLAEGGWYDVPLGYWEHTGSGNSHDGGFTEITSPRGSFRLAGRINLISFGFPCQDLSVAGKRGGIQAPRSGLFFEAMRIVRASMPDYFVFENVKGLLSNNGGKDFERLLREIADSGYDGQWQLLNTRWVLPQNRERIFFIGYPRGKRVGQILPVEQGFEVAERKNRIQQAEVSGTIGPKNNAPNWRWDRGTTLVKTFDLQKRKGYMKETDVAGAITQRDYKGPSRDSATLIQVGTIGDDSEATRVYDPEGCARTIKNGGGMGAKTGLYMIQKSDERLKGKIEPKDSCPTLKAECKKGDTEPLIIEDFFPDRVRTSRDCPALRSDRNGLKVHGKEICNTVTPDAYICRGERNRDENGKAILTSMNERRIRRLTPVECERLQGFPDGWTKGVSDTQRYKCLGNAVTTDVVCLLFSKFMALITGKI